MDMFKVMEMVTLVTTILVFFSGFFPSIEMYKTGNTKNVPYFMFLLSTISCIGMMHYGIILEIITLAGLNGLGAILNALYTSLYLLVVKDKARPIMQLSLTVAFIAVQYGYLYTAYDTEMGRAPLIGQVSSYITTFLMMLPGIELIDNVRNHNADGMPFVMTIMGFICGVSWLIYGMMLEDINIYLPNIPGLTIGLGKIGVFYMYGAQDPNQNKKKL